MKSVISLLGLLTGILAIATSAQAQDADFVCYTQLSNRQIVDLSNLCGSDETSPGGVQELSLAQRQARFLQALYQQFRNHPEREALEQADPDALIGQANQVCEAIENGTYEPPPQIAEIDPEREIANIEEVLVHRVARESFCLGFE